MDRETAWIALLALIAATAAVAYHILFIAGRELATADVGPWPPHA